MKIVVIGGGVAGLSIGWRLRQAGADVTVLERAQPGHGATWASAGMIAVTGEGADDDTPDAPLARHSAELWPAFAAEIEGASKRKISFRADGALMVARDDAHAELFASRAAGSGNHLTYLSPGEAQALEPMIAPDILGALYAPSEAQVDNRALGLALATAFVRAGGVLQSNEAVVRMGLDGTRAFAALTPFNTYYADAFVLAAGAWTSRIEGIPPDALPPVVPVKGEMIALAPPAGQCLPRRIVWSDEIYLVPRHDRLFVGATTSRQGYDTALTESAADWLRSHAGSAMPDLGGWQTAEHWAGLRPGSPDGLPILGTTGIDGLFVASGQFRNGILFAPAIAEVLCSLVLGRLPPSYIAAFSPLRFGDKA